MNKEQEIEKEIQDKGLNAPRLTPELIDSTIASEDYSIFPDSLTTVCQLTLQNGFTVIGTSACASPDNFDEEIGRKIAREAARNKVWELEGYLLKQKLFDANNRDYQLGVKVQDGFLDISISTENLLHACEVGRANGLGDIKITDQKEFLNNVAKQLINEAEDGTTLVHHAFDLAVSEMLEQGENGVEFSED